ncbi:MAG: type II toxin-antitoxin system VapC family toxin [Janthinobacterium lividum]
MRLLLDTHLLLWALAEPERLAPDLVDVIEDPANDVLFSAASIWEIAIKAALNRPDFRFDPVAVTAGAVNAGFAELAVNAADAARVASLPDHHRDPFDRLLVAQAIAHGLWLYTADRLLPPYTPLVRLITPRP